MIPIPALSPRLIVALIGALGVALMVAWIVRLDGLRTHYKTQWETEQVVHKQTVANYQAAYDKAVADATAAKQKKDAEYAAAAKNADASYAALRQRYAAVLRGKTGAGAGHSSGPDLPSSAEGARLPTITAPNPGILVTADDMNVCAANTAYSLAAYEWAKSLQATP